MDAMTSALALLALALGGVAMAMRSSASATVVIGHLFYVADAGWPSGVQEDDDLHWSWSSEPSPVPARGPRAEARAATVMVDTGGLGAAEIVEQANPVGTAPVRGQIARR